jgi:hypothetical protein
MFYNCVVKCKPIVFKQWLDYITGLFDRSNRTESLEIELEEEVDIDEEGAYIL